jgi:hypothetical protein
MTSYFKSTLAAVAVSLALGPGALHAQSDDAAPTPSEEAEAMGFSPTFVRAYDVAMARILQDISHDEQIVLNLAAYAAAAGAMCPDLALDEGGIHGLLAESSHNALAEGSTLTPEQHKEFSLISFGVMVGLILEEAAMDEATFCADAVVYSNETGQALLKQVSTAVQYGNGN